MAIVYLEEHGTVVRKEGRRLVVTKGREIVDEILLPDLERLVIMANVQVTTQAAALLARERKRIVYTTPKGTHIMDTIGEDDPDALPRVKQLAMANDARLALGLAKQIVIGKLFNQRALLVKARVRHANIDKAERGIGEMMDAARNVANAESLLGYEGRAGAWYWPAFQVLLKNDYGFRERKYHPSPDPVNALLSFVYRLLQRDVTFAVQVVGLDRHVGFFHALQAGRPSLVLDLMEEFRPLLCDRIVLDLLNLGMLQARDFVRTANPARPVELDDGAVRRVIETYEKRVGERVRYPYLERAAGDADNKEREFSWRQIFVHQARQCERVIMGEQEMYRAMRDGETGD